MTNSVKAAGLAGVFLVALATATPALSATQLGNPVGELQPVVTELDANASALTYRRIVADTIRAPAFSPATSRPKTGVSQPSAVTLPLCW